MWTPVRGFILTDSAERFMVALCQRKLRKNSFTLCCCISLLLGHCFSTVAICLAVQPDTLTFNHDIRPILSRHCFACHGPDSEDRQAGLRLDSREDALKELASGMRAIIPGNRGV